MRFSYRLSGRAVASAPLLIVFIAAYLPGRVHSAVPPNQTDKLPSDGQWLHEIKDDEFRIIARKTGRQTVSRPFRDGKAIFNYFHES
jgi:hypothetical protein